jgi:hypothetical protein
MTIKTIAIAVSVLFAGGVAGGAQSRTGSIAPGAGEPVTVT